MSLSQLISSKRNRENKNKVDIRIALDDRYANNHQYVLSLLEKYQLPATFFITIAHRAGYDILWNDFLGMIIIYGPEEMRKSKHFLKKSVNKPVSSLALSYDTYTREVVKGGKKTGYWRLPVPEPDVRYNYAGL